MSKTEYFYKFNDLNCAEKLEVLSKTLKKLCQEDAIEDVFANELLFHNIIRVTCTNYRYLNIITHVLNSVKPKRDQMLNCEIVLSDDMIDIYSYEKYNFPAINFDESKFPVNCIDIVQYTEESIDDILGQDYVILINNVDENSIKENKDLSFSSLKAKSHDKAFKAADENDFISLIQLANSLENKEEVLKYLENIYQ